MRLLKTSADSRYSFASGFTVIELAIIMGILVMIFVLGGPTAWRFYLDYQLDSEHELLKSVLRQAGGFSLVNRNESPHGIFWNTDNFILFQGSSFGSRNPAEDRVFPKAKSITISGPNEIVFESLSGRSASSTYSLTNGYKTNYIYINSEGAIND